MKYKKKKIYKIEVYTLETLFGLKTSSSGTSCYSVNLMPTAGGLHSQRVGVAGRSAFGKSVLCYWRTLTCKHFFLIHNFVNIKAANS